jgi:ABC-type uncharacterized transport system substrate-binding protein
MDLSARRARRALAALAAIALGASPALAIHAGHVQGRVLDENGHPIEGAVVTATGDAAVGIWKCRSDGTGFYRIAGLPASTDLRISVEAEGRATVERKGYQVHDDQTLHLNYRLRPKGVYSTLILLDPRVPYHMTALSGARETLPGGVRIFEIKERTPSASRRLARALAARPDGVLAIGSLAARMARDSIFDTPVVYTMVSDPFKENLRVGNMGGVPSNGAFSEQLEMLQKMSPSSRRIGVIFDPIRLDGVVRQLRDEAEGAGFSLEVRAAHQPSDIQAQLLSFESRIDAFMLLLDPGLITGPAFQQIRAFTQERSIILIVPDTSMVSAGATFAYAPGFRELGAYSGRLLTNVMQRKATIGDLGVIYPRTRFLSVNPQDVDRLDLKVPLSLGDETSTSGPRIEVRPGG